MSQIQNKKKSSILWVMFWKKFISWSHIWKVSNSLRHIWTKGLILCVILKKKGSIRRVILKKNNSLSQTRKSSILCVWKKSSILCVEIEKVQFLETCREFNSLSHIEKKFSWKMFNSWSHILKKGSILWVTFQKKGSNSLTHFQKIKDPFFEYIFKEKFSSFQKQNKFLELHFLKMFNSLSHMKKLLCESYSKKNVKILWVI